MARLALATCVWQKNENFTTLVEASGEHIIKHFTFIWPFQFHNPNLEEETGKHCSTFLNYLVYFVWRFILNFYCRLTFQFEWISDQIVNQYYFICSKSNINRIMETLIDLFLADLEELDELSENTRDKSLLITMILLI